MAPGGEFSRVPVVDVAGLVGDRAAREAVARQLDAACRESGFFYVVGHGVDEALQNRLRERSREFFSLETEEKMRVRMALGGRAWRGYFRVGDELTSGKPDQKEGLYFGQELPPDDPRVVAGTPLHGPNLFPERPEGLREAVLDYMAALTGLGHRLMAGLALGLGLDEAYFEDHGTREPLTLFRIFNYPPPADPSLWGVGEHTDYGLLTILLQDDAGGLEVKSRSSWIPAPPLPGSYVCNIGDMLDRMTGGVYRSTPHRVRNPAPRDRMSFPFFFDPNFSAPVRPIDLPGRDRPADDAAERWDRASVHMFDGTYGDYLLTKVGKVFPELRSTVL
ncbi:2-oxoglutarate-dependent ethylene/succinate-forming enzyme [Aquisphaera giovannonii]|uniref:2-oxoglutarate-dependent ethylene/succinate-forming enzyme n=1 Tax=Aquisphaera giovannonii TaxID=406548 RepID=A0A5B9W318_9BACT|nr:2-oxoglutarate and iron-dependent oxygenase domain-containing protein [Aquisphaera giovannonii]QEH34481.1 2-oxoglutarate-dependent ethylene/succinate-forming enzyme [Aquisphaera giovannonii]